MLTVGASAGQVQPQALLNTSMLTASLISRSRKVSNWMTRHLERRGIKARKLHMSHVPRQHAETDASDWRWPGNMRCHQRPDASSTPQCGFRPAYPLLVNRTRFATGQSLAGPAALSWDPLKRRSFPPRQPPTFGRANVLPPALRSTEAEYLWRAIMAAGVQ